MLFYYVYANFHLVFGKEHNINVQMNTPHTLLEYCVYCSRLSFTEEGANFL